MATALSTRVDWRDISKRLNDPKQRRGIVTKTDTEELNRLRTKNAYVNRKRKILDQILRLTNFYSPRPIYVPTRPENAGRSAGPPSTHHGVGPSSFPGAALGPTTAGPGPGPEDSDSEEVDMGDYEKRIRPSSAFWRRPDGMSLAEKIIYYRNWKYLNVPRQRPTNQAMDGDMEATLAEYRLGMSSMRRSVTVLASSTLRNRQHPPSAAAAADDSPRSRRPISVIPRITRERHDAVMFPLIDTHRHVLSRSARDLRSDDDRLPPIEENQLVSRKTAETEIDGEEDGKNKNRNRKKKKKGEEGRAPKDPRPNTEPDKLIRKLDRKMERDLKGLQGQDNNDDDDDDDDDSDVDEETMNDLLFGEKSKEFDRFLRS